MATATSTPPTTIQGVPANDAQIDPATFFQLTRRQRGPMVPSVGAFAGLGNTDSGQLRQTGILAALDIKFVGTLTVTPGTGTVASTPRWPYGLFKTVSISANGQSNLIQCSGTFLKARQLASYPGLTDRGVAQGIGGASPGTTVYSGSMALASESWGVGQNVSAIAGGAYAVDLTVRIPIAWDEVKLLGALFLQTQSTSVDYSVTWGSQSDLFALTGNGAVALAGGFSIEGIVFTIPQSNGKAVVPDLSVFHALTQSQNTTVGETSNEIILVGQGVGKTLMRIFFRLLNGATPAPLALNETNWGQVGWKYGLNEAPETYADGMGLRRLNEEIYGSDLGGNPGIGVIDFASHWSFRDSVDEGSASQIRLLLQPQVALTNPLLEYVQETIIAGATAA